MGQQVSMRLQTALGKARLLSIPTLSGSHAQSEALLDWKASADSR
jgi:hypothetical protein